MTEKDLWILGITALFTILAAVLGAAVTLWWQTRREKRDAKLRIFTTLMMYRRSSPPTVEWVNAINLIDVIFADCPTVITKWHELYRTLHGQAGTQQHQHALLEMLSEMAQDLGYQSLKVTDIDKFYVPDAHVLQAQSNAQLQQQAIAFFTLLNSLAHTQGLNLTNVVKAPDQSPVKPPHP